MNERDLYFLMRLVVDGFVSYPRTGEAAGAIRLHKAGFIDKEDRLSGLGPYGYTPTKVGRDFIKEITTELRLRAKERMVHV